MSKSSASKKKKKRRDLYLDRGILWSIISYLLTNITVTAFSFLFFVLNRTRVIGRRNVGHERNTLLISNHQSMIDSFIVGLAAFHPQSYLKPYLLPWNPAAEENFFHPAWLGWLSRHWRCIPVREGRRDPRALHRMVEILPTGVMTVFPEGELIIVPRGVEHMPVAAEECHVLLFEPASTLNTGNVDNERTVKKLDRL